MLLINFIIFLLALIFLVKGSNYFVKSASSISKKFGVSEFVIGLTLVAVGTSLPELFSSIIASTKNESGLVVGTILGANIANISLILGIASLIGIIKTRKEILKRDGYMLFFSALLLTLFMIDHKISRLEGSLFFILFGTYLLYVFGSKELKGKYGFKHFIPHFFKLQYLTTVKSKVFTNKKIKIHEKKKIKKSFKEGIIKDILILILSGAAMLFGAKYLINEAVYFAESFDIPRSIIGVLMAIGTTLPELSVAINAARRGHGNIIIGNALGSCITNTLLILGISSIINPLIISQISLMNLLPFFIFLNVILLIFIRTDWKIKRFEGIVLLLTYLVFLAELIYKVL